MTQPSEFQRVSRSHIVPKFYLRSWSQNDQLSMHDVRSGREEVRNLKSAGVIRDFYVRERPDGEIIHDIEWSLGQAENATAPRLRALPQQWPPTPSDKNALAQFFGLQHVRGPAFRDWRARIIEGVARSLGGEGQDPGDIDAAVKSQVGSTQDNAQMLRLSRVAASVFGSMHWTLVRFDEPWLVTSDQPVVVWPAERESTRPRANDDSAGLIDIFEAFVPLDPRHLLLMSWTLAVDSDVRGDRGSAAVANAFCIANAESQWFHQIRAEVPLTEAPCGPLTPKLVDGSYSVATVRQSSRRAAALDLANEMLTAPLDNRAVPIVCVDISGRIASS